jgi:hypothetical protein
MIAVIEGTDHAGKTTLAQRLADEYVHGPLLSDLEHRRVARMHKGPPDDRPILEQYEGDLLTQFTAAELTSLELLVILDRWHLGEWLYGPLLRGKSRLTEPQLVHIEMLLSALGAQRHVAVADQASLVRRHELEPDELITVSEAIGVQAAYQGLTYVLSDDWRMISMRDGSITSAYELLATLIRSSSFAAALADFPSYVGPERPKALLVGDKPGGCPPSWARAFTPLKPGSASMLIASLKDSGLHNVTGLVNQKDTNLTGLWYALNMPFVIALGDEAARAVAGSSIIEWQAAPHPQFIRRFRSSGWDEYVLELKEMINA